MAWWHLGAAANIVILVAYLTIGVTIARALLRSGQRAGDNPLAWATAAIFLTSAVHYGMHPLHQMLPYAGLGEQTGSPLRAAFDGWHVAGWDIVTALVALWYLNLRGRFPALVRGSALFEDIKVRQQQALEIHDDILQGLATAKLSFELGEGEEGLRAVEDTLAASRRIITGMLGDERSEIEFVPGDFRRQTAARS